jgi:hypothetical protein
MSSLEENARIEETNVNAAIRHFVTSFKFLTLEKRFFKSTNRLRGRAAVKFS